MREPRRASQGLKRGASPEGSEIAGTGSFENPNLAILYVDSLLLRTMILLCIGEHELVLLAGGMDWD